MGLKEREAYRAKEKTERLENTTQDLVDKYSPGITSGVVAIKDVQTVESPKRGRPPKKDKVEKLKKVFFLPEKDQENLELLLSLNKKCLSDYLTDLIVADTQKNKGKITKLKSLFED